MGVPPSFRFPSKNKLDCPLVIYIYRIHLINQRISKYISNKKLLSEQNSNQYNTIPTAIFLPILEVY